MPLNDISKLLLLHGLLKAADGVVVVGVSVSLEGPRVGWSKVLWRSWPHVTEHWRSSTWAKRLEGRRRRKSAHNVSMSICKTQSLTPSSTTTTMRLVSAAPCIPSLDLILRNSIKMS